MAYPMETSSIKFGPGMTREVGYKVARHGGRRVMLVTDARVAKLPVVGIAAEFLRDAGIDTVLYDRVRTEPTERVVPRRHGVCRRWWVRWYVAVGGGSVIDTAKAANLYATYRPICSPTSTRQSATLVPFPAH